MGKGRSPLTAQPTRISDILLMLVAARNAELIVELVGNTQVTHRRTEPVVHAGLSVRARISRLLCVRRTNRLRMRTWFSFELATSRERVSNSTT